MEEIITAWMAYDASQLLPAVNSMIKKLKKYLTLALGKTAPICAMILEPHIKMDYMQKHSAFIKKEIRSDFNTLLIISEFKVEAKHFNCSPARCNPQLSSTQNKQTTVVKKVFTAGQATDDLDLEIRKYFQAKIEGEHINVLDYWRTNQSIFLSMAAMARCFLAIPATSAPSEQVFSKCKAVIGPQRASLSPQSIEHLLCLKEWYCSFGTVDPAPYNTDPLDSDDA
jgi:hypothetical protein